MTTLQTNDVGAPFMATASRVSLAYNISGIRYKKSIGQKLSVILDSELGQEDYAKS